MNKACRGNRCWWIFRGIYFLISQQRSSGPFLVTVRRTLKTLTLGEQGFVMVPNENCPEGANPGAVLPTEGRLRPGVLGYRQHSCRNAR